MPRTFKSDTYKQHVAADFPPAANCSWDNWGNAMPLPDKITNSTTIFVTNGSSTNSPQYKYSEDEFLRELQAHVDSTYTSHYGGQIQPVEFIMSNAETLDYLKGNVVKYIYRFGKKDGSNRKDLMKACHFIMMMARYGDKEK
jgi:hypothetical protein